MTNDENCVITHDGFNESVMRVKRGVWARERREEGELQRQRRTVFDAERPDGICDNGEHAVIVRMDLAIRAYMHVNTTEVLGFVMKEGVRTWLCYGERRCRPVERP